MKTIVIEHRLTKIEQKLKNLQDDLEHFFNNDFKHLEQEVAYIKNKFNWFIGLLVVNLVGIIVFLIQNKIQ